MDELNHAQPMDPGDQWQPADCLAEVSRYKSIPRNELVAELQRLKGLVADLTRCRENASEVMLQRKTLQDQTLQLLEKHRRAIDAREGHTELYEFAPITYVTLDRFGVVKQINLTGAAMLGSERRFVEGHPLLPYVVPEDREAFLDHMRRCRAAEVEPVTTQLRIQPRSGPQLPVQLRSTPAKAGGATVYRTGVSDLTELKSTEEALRAAQEELHRARRLASLGTLAAGVAHEINNPLNSINMLAQLARTEPDLNPDLQEVFRQIAEQTERCGRIVRSMLNFARSGASVKEHRDLEPVIHRAAHIIRSDLHLPGLELTVNVAPRLPRVRINSLEFEQVLINLVRNAAEASPRGVRVEIAAEARNGHVLLRVVDDGPGIPSEHLPHIFDPFYSTRVNRGGTGLGLSISHAIVTEHSGSISVENKPGGGAAFTIQLPAASD